MAGWTAAAIVGSSLIGANASSHAASAQADSANQSNALQKEMFDEQNRLNAPFRENGLAGQNRLMDLLGLSKNTGAQGYGSLNKQFGDQPFTQDPSYQWRLQQGQKALERSAAARGGLFSGRAAKDLTDYAQGAASQEYGNAYNRFQTDRSNILNPLQSLSGQAQSATNQMSNNASNYATNVGNGLAAAGAANGSGYMGQANAISGGLNSYLNYNQGQNMLNAYSNRNNFPTTEQMTMPLATGR